MRKLDHSIQEFVFESAKKAKDLIHGKKKCCTFREFMEGITKIFLFDFDSTLVMTPEEDEVKKRWQQATGQPWPHKGIWGRRETLTPPVFHATPDDLNHDVIKDFMRAKADPHGRVIMMTGRHSGIQKEVQAILQKYELFPDEQYYKGSPDLVKHPEYPKKGDTWDYKKHVLTKNLAPRPGIELIEIWDDREDHMPKWMEAARWIRANYPIIQSVVLHDVKQKKTYSF